MSTPEMRLRGVDEKMRAQLRKLSRAPDAGWWVRERVDMVLLAAKGWSAPLIAQHLGCSDKTVRRMLRAFEAHGVEALERQVRGPAPDVAQRQQVHAALAALLAQPRTWTSGQLALALREHGVQLGARQVRRYLAELGASWQRTKMTLVHKQRGDEVERAHRHLSRLKKRPSWEGRPLLPG